MAVSRSGDDVACLVIAEAGVNHNGSEELALKLVVAAARAGADAVKFQTFRPETLVRPGAEKAAYQRARTGTGDQFSMLEALTLSESSHRRLFERCRELGIEFLSTPFDEAAADFLVGLGVRRVKVASGDLTNVPLLAHLAASGLPLIVSTGMATLEEVAEAVEVVSSARAERGFAAPLAQGLTLLHCTSNYPTALEDVNLRAMLTLRERFGLPCGYSDHTPGTLIAPVAAALGAVIIEKHFTLDRSLPGPDHQASLEPGELAQMIADIRAVERSLGSGEKVPRPCELTVRDLVRRSVTLRRPLRAGEALTREDLVVLRPGTGIPPRDLPRLAGRRVRRDLPAGAMLEWSDIEP